MRYLLPGLLVLALVATPATAQNLLTNGDAEAGPGGNGTTIVPPPGWVLTGDFTAVHWSNGSGWMTPSAPGPSNRGSNYFAGGYTALSEAEQTFDLSGQAALIDAGGLQYLLEGWLGGWDTQDDHAQVYVTFEDAGGLNIGIDSIGPVLASHRNNVTGLLQRSQIGTVPVGSRLARVAIILTRTDQLYNDGYADNVSFDLVQSTGLILTGPSSVTAGSAIQLTVLGGTLNGTARSGYSLTGAGPTVTLFGTLALSPPIKLGPSINLDSVGVGSVIVAIPAAASGRTIWVQVRDEASLNLSNGLSVVVF